MRKGVPLMAWILVIEDDEATQLFLADLLAEEGHSVLQAADGATGLMTLRAAEYPLVVLVDYRLPDMLGTTLFGEVAKDAQLLQRHAYLFVTADAQHLPSTEQALLDAQHLSVIAKPFDRNEPAASHAVSTAVVRRASSWA